MEVSDLDIPVPPSIARRLFRFEAEGTDSLTNASQNPVPSSSTNTSVRPSPQEPTQPDPTVPAATQPMQSETPPRSHSRQRSVTPDASHLSTLKQWPYSRSQRKKSTSRGRNRSSMQPTVGEEDLRNTTPVQRTQYQAQIALNNMEPAPPELRAHMLPKLIAQNVQLILDATKDPTEDHNPRHMRGRSPGKTSSRSLSKSEEAKTKQEPNPKAETERPLKILKSGSAARIPDQVAPDLPTLNPEPLQLEFPQHPIRDRSDEWFVHEFRKLFRHIERFFDEYFCHQNLDDGETYEPWAVNHTPEFLNYVLLVTEEDPGQGGWDKVLRDTAQRKWLLMGVLMRILEVKVFHEDLWGATKEEKDLVFAIEKALFTQEGFSRTNLRSETVRTILGPSPMTENFHSEVAKLTAQVSLLFKPLSDFLYRISSPEGKPAPLIWDQYQSLHNIISSAAYLSLCIRLSPTIFYFTALYPNEPYNPDEQHDLESEISTASKQKIADEWTAATTAWNEKRMEMEETVQNLTKDGHIETPYGQTAKSDLAALLATRPNPPIYRSLSKIAAWPNIRRFKPGSEVDEKAGCALALEEKTGFRIYDISKSAGVFYFGIEDRMEREKSKVCLRGFVEGKQRAYGQGVGKRENRVVTAVPYALGTMGMATLLVWYMGWGGKIDRQFERGLDIWPALRSSSWR